MRDRRRPSDELDAGLALLRSAWERGSDITGALEVATSAAARVRAEIDRLRERVEVLEAVR